jgi:radical SAM superfamily enzyme YgiQ (UPF0313 family)
MGSNIINAVRLSRLIKEISPKTPVVWGGPLATSSPEICFLQAPVDYIAMGMGEESAVLLADRLRETGRADGLENVSSHIDGTMIIKDKYFFSGELDDLPYVSLENSPARVYRDRKIPLLSSRGCPRSCAFCYNSTFAGSKKWYYRSAGSVLDEMGHWASHFGLNSFYFIDDNLLVNPGRAQAILEGATSRGYSIEAVRGHIGDYSDDLLEIIARSVDKLSFSIESASPRIQGLINKSINMEKARRLFGYFTGKGVKTLTTNFMFGFPSETDDDISANIQAAVELRALSRNLRMVPYIYTPQPGDTLMRSFEAYLAKINFTLDNLSTSDFAPNRTKYISHELRPWMSGKDIEFYLNLVLVWFYHFDPVTRQSQFIDVPAIMRSDDRISRLFAGVREPE